MKRGYLSNWPSWLPRSSPCVFAGRGQWARARKLLARDDEGTTCAIVSRPGAVVGVVTLDGREAWVRGELVQPRRPSPGRWATRVKSYKQQTISLPPSSSVPIVWGGSGWRKVRAKLRSGLMRFEEWGSV